MEVSVGKTVNAVLFGPDELLLNILGNLDPQDLTKTAEVCRRFYHLSRVNSLWEPYLEKKRLNPSDGNIFKQGAYKEIFINDPNAREDPYLACDPQGSELYKALSELPSSSLCHQAIKDLKTAKMILVKRSLYQKILENPDSDLHLTYIAQAHPEAAQIILNDPKFYDPLIASDFSNFLIKKIANSHLEGAILIFGKEKLYNALIVNKYDSSFTESKALKSIIEKYSLKIKKKSRSREKILCALKEKLKAQPNIKAGIKKSSIHSNPFKNLLKSFSNPLSGFRSTKNFIV